MARSPKSPVAVSKFSKEEVLAAVKAAKEAPFTPAGVTCGCGRAYVVLTCGKAETKLVAEACKELGLMFLKEAYGVSGPAIYIGYDNCDGKALARSRVFAETLKAKGLTCYDDAVGD